MRSVFASGLLFLLLSGLAVGPVTVAFAATSTTATSTIPPQLITYLENMPPSASPMGCVSGTIDPFSINSTSCTYSPGGRPQSYTTSCSSDCQNGGYTLASTNYILYEAYFTAPSNPTVSPSYSGSTAFSDWIGLQNCITGCNGGTAYLLQAGEIWGGFGKTSSTPVVFTEFAESTGTCSAGYLCANIGTFTVTAGTDTINPVVEYDGTSNQWYLYSGDTSANKYISQWVDVGTGNGEIPLSSMNHGLASSEGQGTTASNQIPGGVSIYDIEGEYTSLSFGLGSQTPWNNPSSGSQSVTLSWSTTTCSGGVTCGTQGITVT